MMTATATATCPVCGAMIPLPHTDAPTPKGFSFSFDTRYLDEHADMHTRCTCWWAPFTLDEGCAVHG